MLPLNGSAQIFPTVNSVSNLSMHSLPGLLLPKHGPLLFILLVNYLPNNCQHIRPCLFADETNLWYDFIFFALWMKSLLMLAWVMLKTNCFWTHPRHSKSLSNQLFTVFFQTKKITGTTECLKNRCEHRQKKFEFVFRIREIFRKLSPRMFVLSTRCQIVAHCFLTTYYET